jgi:rod shape-determining protein MreD
MNHLLYILICLILILIQSTVVHGLSIFNGFYDLLTVVVIFLGIYRSLREGIPVILFAGFVMDSLYNGPFGIYLSVYCWLYFCIRWCSVYFNVRSIWFLALIVPAGVIFENMMFFSFFAAFDSGSFNYSGVYLVIVEQIIWSMTIGPVLIMLLNFLQDIWNRMFNPQISGQKGY